jgi:hypothetical protein
MKRLYVPTNGLECWRERLADPARQWRPRKSAYEMAMAWESASGMPRGLPHDLCTLLDSTSVFAGARLLAGFPEHQVTLKGRGHASQTDLWALLCADVAGVFSLAVEGKAGESFGLTVQRWFDGRSGTSSRLQQLCEVLAISEAQAQQCRYQLLHRAIAAIVEAKRFRLGTAVFLVQSFGRDEKGFRDYITFARQLGVDVRENAVVDAGVREGIRLYIGWLTCAFADAESRGETIEQ